MPAPEVRERFRALLLRPVLDFAEIWFRRRDKITFHDPLTATTIFDEQICQFERGNANVELAADHSLGRTDWSPDENGQQEVAMQVNPTKFFDHFFSVMG